MRCTSLASGALERCELRRTYTPITSRLAGNDMKTKVRCLLSAVDAVVLERENSERLVGLHERRCDPLGCAGYSATFFVRELEQRRHVTTCNHTTLANLELPWIYDSERMVTFVNDCPPCRSARHSLAEIARVSYWKLDQRRSPIQAVTPALDSFPVPFGSIVLSRRSGCDRRLRVELSANTVTKKRVFGATSVSRLSESPGSCRYTDDRASLGHR